MPFAAAERDLHRAARDGLAARLSGKALSTQSISSSVRSCCRVPRLVSVRTGAAWQTETVRYLAMTDCVINPSAVHHIRALRPSAGA
jgi:hypothetical protein